MANSPTLGLTMMSASQAQKEVVFNEFLIAMDALFRGVVISAARTSPPTSPNAGDTYIVASGATGAWSGQDHNIAFYFNGWQFVTAKDHMRLYDQTATVWRVYHAGTTSWDAEPASTVSVLNDLTNVQGSPTNGQVLTYVLADGKWEPKDAVFTAALSALTDVSVTEGSAIDGKGLAWNQTDHKWEAKAFLSSVPAFMSLPGVNSPTGLGDHWVAVYNASGPGLTFMDPASIIAVSGLNQIGDVAYPVGGVGAIPTGASLVWNGATWAPSSDAPATIGVSGIIDGPGSMDGNVGKIIRVNSVESAWEYVPNTLANLADVNVTEGTGIDGYVLSWSYGTQKWVAIPPNTNSLAALTDVAVTENSGYDNTFLYWNNTAGKWAQKLLLWADIQGKPTLFSGAYADLTGKPSLSAVATSGAYSDLSGKPTLFSGAYADLTGKPSLATVATSGAYSDLTGKPTIPTNGGFNLASLGDVSVTTGSGVDGYVVYWDNGSAKFKLKAAGGGALSALSDVNVTEGSGIDGYYLKWDNGTSKWVAAAVSGGGGGSSTLAGDADVNLASPSDGQVLTYDAATSKWINADPTGSGGGGSGSVPVYTPPNPTALTAVTNLGAGTQTLHTSGGIPSMVVVPSTSDGDGTCYTMMKAVPSGNFSAVVKCKTVAPSGTTGWKGCGIAVYRSGGPKSAALFLRDGGTWYVANYASGSGFTGGNPINSSTMSMNHEFLHIDYDGTNLTFSVSDNGIDKVPLYSASASSVLGGAPTHAGPMWGPADTNWSPRYTFEHFYVGAANTNGISLGGGGGGSSTLAGLTDVSESTPANNQTLLYDSGASLWKNVNSPYNVAAFLAGAMTNGETLVAHIPPVAVAIDASNCRAKAGAAATGSTTVNVTKNGTTVGTIVWSCARHVQ